jgi:L,D-transpeptidase ErfK/SrfK
MTLWPFLSWLVSLYVASGLELARATTFPLPSPSTELVGQITYVTTSYEDTLLDIARRHGLGYQEVVLANPGVDPWLPGEGTRVLLPTRYLLPATPREGIVINRAEMRLYYYPALRSHPVNEVITYPVGIGRVEWETPLAVTRVTGKVVDPTWYPPASIRAEHAEDENPLPSAVPPGPDNPLGRFAINLGLAGYLIHGSNRSYGIGMRVSHGCIRLYPDDIEALFTSVPIGTPVRIINQPFKTGWADNVLYLEVHPTGGDNAKQVAMQDLSSLVRMLVMATQKHPERPLNWARAEKIARSPRGIPLAVTGDGEKPPRSVSHLNAIGADARDETTGS